MGFGRLVWTAGTGEMVFVVLGGGLVEWREKGKEEEEEEEIEERRRKMKIPSSYSSVVGS